MFMNESIQHLNTKIIEISQNVDSTVKEITMLVHKINSVNSNGLDFLKEYTEKYMNTLVDKPVVCKYYPLKDDLGTHEQVVDKKTGKIVELKTIAIGTITDVWIDKVSETDETEALFAKSTIWSYKYPKIMSCIEDMFEKELSTSSVEVEIYKYGDNPTKDYRFGKDFTYIGNCLLGSTVTPADSDAGIVEITDKEIASVIEEDLNNLTNTSLNSKKEGVEIMEDKDFNKGFETRFHGDLEINSLKFSEVRNQIYNLLNPIDPKNNSRKYNYYIRDMYTDYTIVEEWDDYSTLWKIGYKIENDVVVLETSDKWIKGSLGFIPDGIDLDSMIAELEKQKIELNNINKKHEKELNNVADENSKQLEDLEATNKELSEKVEALTTKVEELNEVIVSQQETITKHEDTVKELNESIATLEPYKVKVETAEQEAKQSELSSKYAKLLPEELMKSERAVNAIQELNSADLSEMVVEHLAKEKELTAKQVEVVEDNVVVTASRNEDLLPTSSRDKWYSTKSE